ncbi:MAG: hypothetical protein JW863_04020 [Chitinispirillaceae bacterium]|nr:hypothetical protein [Chitinispirillaceae bacterium]
MNKNSCTIIDLYQVITLSCVAFATGKFAHHWHAGLADTTGRAIDVTITTVANKLEKNAQALEEWANSGTGKNQGNGIDKVLTDTKKALESATELIQRVTTNKKQSENRS